jgi:hypothetical protein
LRATARDPDRSSAVIFVDPKAPGIHGQYHQDHPGTLENDPMLISKSRCAPLE